MEPNDKIIKTTILATYVPVPSGFMRQDIRSYSVDIPFLKYLTTRIYINILHIATCTIPQQEQEIACSITFCVLKAQIDTFSLEMNRSLVQFDCHTTGIRRYSHLWKKPFTRPLTSTERKGKSVEDALSEKAPFPNSSRRWSPPLYAV